MCIMQSFVTYFINCPNRIKMFCKLAYFQLKDICQVTKTLTWKVIFEFEKKYIESFDKLTSLDRFT